MTATLINDIPPCIYILRCCCFCQSGPQSLYLFTCHSSARFSGNQFMVLVGASFQVLSILSRTPYPTRRRLHRVKTQVQDLPWTENLILLGNISARKDSSTGWGWEEKDVLSSLIWFIVGLFFNLLFWHNWRRRRTWHFKQKKTRSRLLLLSIAKEENKSKDFDCTQTKSK